MRVLLRQQRRDLPDPVAQALESGLVAKQGEMKAQSQQVEAFRLLVLRVEFCRQACHLVRKLGVSAGNLIQASNFAYCATSPRAH